MSCQFFFSASTITYGKQPEAELITLVQAQGFKGDCLEVASDRKGLPLLIRLMVLKSEASQLLQVPDIQTDP